MDPSHIIETSPVMSEKLVQILAISWWGFILVTILYSIFVRLIIYNERQTGHHDSKVKKNQKGRTSYLRRREEQNNNFMPGVSIIRPLKGVDSNLELNIRSSFEQDYENKQIILCVEDDKDPCVPIAIKIMKEYSHVESYLLIGADDKGANPKINNLLKGYEKAKYNYLWMYDSNIWFRSTALRSSVQKLMKKDVGIVHHLPIATETETLGSSLESIYMSTSHARHYLAFNSVDNSKLSCVVGKSMLLKKEILEECGGLAQFANYLAEDLMMTIKIKEKGYVSTMTNDIAFQSVNNFTIYDYINRRIRWGRLRTSVIPHATLLEPFSESFILIGLILSIPLNIIIPSFSILQLFLIHYALFSVLCLFFFNLWGGKINHRTLAAWIIKDILYFPLYLASITGNTISWRNREFMLLADSVAKPLRTSMKANKITKPRMKLDKDDGFSSAFISMFSLVANSCYLIKSAEYFSLLLFCLLFYGYLCS